MMDVLTAARSEVELCQKVFGEDRNGWTRASRALAALVAEIDAAPIVEVKRGLRGGGLIVCETGLDATRVRLLALDSASGEKGGGNLPPPLDSGGAGEVGRG